MYNISIMSFNLCIFIFLFFSNLLDCGNNRYASPFLRIPVGAITSGSFESYTAMVGLDSVLYNPAGNGLLTYSGISLTHNKYFEDMNQEYISSTINSRWGNFSVFYSVLSSGKFVSYDENENIIGKTSTSHKFYGFTYSKGFPYFEYANRRIDPMLITPSWTKIKPVKVYIPKVYRASFGVSIKKVEEVIDSERSSTFVFDIGGILILPGHFHIGSSFQNIGGKQKFVYDEAKIPKVFRFGIAKDFSTVKELMNFIFMVDFVKDDAIGRYFNFGIETDIVKAFQARGGYTTREKEGSKLSFGIGMNFDRLISKESIFKGLRMDYAYISYGALGPTHKIGFQVVW